MSFRMPPSVQVGKYVLVVYVVYSYYRDLNIATDFDQKTLKAISARLQPLRTKQNPLHGEIGGLWKVQFVRPELVAEIKFAEWTH